MTANPEKEHSFQRKETPLSKDAANNLVTSLVGTASGSKEHPLRSDFHAEHIIKVVLPKIVDFLTGHRLPQSSSKDFSNTFSGRPSFNLEQVIDSFGDTSEHIGSLTIQQNGMCINNEKIAVEAAPIMAGLLLCSPNDQARSMACEKLQLAPKAVSEAATELAVAALLDPTAEVRVLAFKALAKHASSINSETMEKIGAAFVASLSIREKSDLFSKDVSGIFDVLASSNLPVSVFIEPLMTYMEAHPKYHPSHKGAFAAFASRMSEVKEAMKVEGQFTQRFKNLIEKIAIEGNLIEHYGQAQDNSGCEILTKKIAKQFSNIS